MKTDIEYLTAAKDVIVKRDTTYNDWDFMRQKMTEKPSEMVIDALSQRLERCALLALQKQREDLKAESDHHYKIIEGDEINSFLSIILRKLDQDKLIVLRDALIQRTPELKWKSELKTKIDKLRGDHIPQDYEMGLNKVLEILNSL